MCYYFIIYYLTDYVEIFSFDTALKYFLSTFQVFTFFYLCFSGRRRDEIVCGSKINISRKDFGAKPLAIPETVQFSEPWFQPMWRMNHLIIFNRQYSKNCLDWSFFFFVTKLDFPLIRVLEHFMLVLFICFSTCRIFGYGMANWIFLWHAAFYFGIFC